jgi:dihydrofolate reductase
MNAAFMTFQPRESGIHAVWPDAGGVSVTEVRFRRAPRSPHIAQEICGAGCPRSGFPLVCNARPSGRTVMSHVIVIEFVSLDGVMQDPDGNEGFRHGGWAFRYGPEAVTGDPFGLSEVLDTGALLLGRRTWQMFAGIWPGRDDPFSAKMNAMPKLVMSRSLEHAGGWQNSTVLREDLVTEAGKRKQEQDIVVMGSASVVHALTAADLVDEYRLLVFPLVIGAGTRLFPDGTAPADLALVSAGTRGAAARLIYTRSGNS